MFNKEFKVYNKKPLILFIITLFQVLSIISMVYFEWHEVPRYPGETHASSIPLVLVLLFLAIMEISFCAFGVEVSGSGFFVRNRLGRTYRFACSDIEAIECRPRLRRAHELCILASSRNLRLYVGMVNLDTLASYLLDKLKDGEINPNAITPYSMNELILYSEDSYNRGERIRQKLKKLKKQ